MKTRKYSILKPNATSPTILSCEIHESGVLLRGAFPIFIGEEIKSAGFSASDTLEKPEDMDPKLLALALREGNNRGTIVTDVTPTPKVPKKFVIENYKVHEADAIERRMGGEILVISAAQGLFFINNRRLANLLSEAYEDGVRGPIVISAIDHENGKFSVKAIEPASLSIAPGKDEGNNDVVHVKRGSIVVESFYRLDAAEAFIEDLRNPEAASKAREREADGKIRKLRNSARIFAADPQRNGE